MKAVIWQPAELPHQFKKKKKEQVAYAEWGGFHRFSKQTPVMAHFTPHQYYEEVGFGEVTAVLINKISIRTADIWETTHNLQAWSFFLEL